MGIDRERWVYRERGDIVKYQPIPKTICSRPRSILVPYQCLQEDPIASGESFFFGSVALMMESRVVLQVQPLSPRQ